MKFSKIRLFVFLSFFFASFLVRADVHSHIPKIILFYSSVEPRSFSEIEEIRRSLLTQIPTPEIFVKNFQDFNRNQNKAYQFLAAQDIDSIVPACVSCREALTALRNQHLLQNINLISPEGALSLALAPRPARQKDVTANYRPLTPLDGQDLSHRAMFLFDPQEALQAHVSLIRGAKKSLDVTMYIHNSDDAGLLQFALLRDAARRGVKVRLVIDDMGSRNLSNAFLRHLRDEGIEVKLYHKTSLVNWAKSNRRLHDKYICADGQFKIVGGRNRTNSNFNVNPEGNPFNHKDLEIYLESNKSEGKNPYFETLWNSSEVDDPSALDKVSVQDIKEADAQLGLHESQDFKSLINRWNLDAWKKLVPVHSPEFIFDPLGVTDNSEGVATNILALIAEARADITFVTPYFILTKEFKDAVKEARARGVNIKVITNSVETVERPWLSAATNGQLKMLRQLGLTVLQYKGPQSLHAKAVIIDGGRKFFVGSYNIDPRSQKLNTETGVIIENEELGKQLLGFTEDLARNSWDYSQPGDEAPLSLRAMCSRLLEFPVKMEFVRGKL